MWGGFVTTAVGYAAAIGATVVVLPLVSNALARLAVRQWAEEHRCRLIECRTDWCGRARFPFAWSWGGSTWEFRIRVIDARGERRSGYARANTATWKVDSLWDEDAG
jgi:hypothetical protein